jgi:dynein heavy chain
MKFGFDLFKINYVPSPDLEYVEKEITSLEDVWNTKENWDNKYKDFCKFKFKEAKIDELDDDADDYTRKLT